MDSVLSPATLEDADVCTCLSDSLGWAAVALYRDGRLATQFTCAHTSGIVTSRFQPEVYERIQCLKFIASVDTGQCSYARITFLVPVMELYQASLAAEPQGGWDLVPLAEKIPELFH